MWHRRIAFRSREVATSGECLASGSLRALGTSHEESANCSFWKLDTYLLEQVSYHMPLSKTEQCHGKCSFWRLDACHLEVSTENALFGDLASGFPERDASSCSEVGV